MAKKHIPLEGYKLVGLVALGVHPPYDAQGETPEMVFNVPRIRVTNPNCRGDIVVTKMSIIRSSVTPAPPGVVEVKYEGKFLALTENENWEVVPKNVMKPHESWACLLHLIPDLGGLNQKVALYTVEIFWEPKIKGALPLIGFQLEAIRIFDGTRATYFSDSQSQMVNMVNKV